MAQGKVSVNNLNLSQGDFPEVERVAFFVGIGTKNIGQVLSIDSQTDFDDILGVADSEIKRNVLAAMQNGGENWHAYACPQNNGYTFSTVVTDAMDSISPELIALCTPSEDGDDLEDLNTLAEMLRTTYARRVIILTATAGINPGTQTWAQYETAQIAIQADVAAYRIAVVPQLHGNDLGVLVGRLCNRSVSIADSPMRVATGALIGLGDTPEDSAGETLSHATLANLASNRLSCIQKYVDYPGVYWGDCSLLDAAGGDFQVIEYLRPVDKAARAVRLLAIPRVADRKLNSTPVSLSAHRTYFSRPLREMSHSSVVGGQTFPGDIKPPGPGAVTIIWPTKTKVEVYIKVQPYNSPKEIEANIVLDLSVG